MPARRHARNGEYFVYKTNLTKRGYYSKQPICQLHLEHITTEFGPQVRFHSFWKIARGDDPRAGRYVSKMLSFVVWERQSGKCANCPATFAFSARRPRAKSDGWAGTWECDHVVPVFDGGKTTLGNLQALCYDCHAEKSRGEKSRAALSRHTRTSRAFRSTNYEKNEKIDQLIVEVAALKAQADEFKKAILVLFAINIALRQQRG